MRSGPPPFDPAALAAVARDAYLKVARAAVEQRPDPARQVMTDTCWEQLRQRVGAMGLDGASQRYDGLIVSAVNLLGWDESGGMHRALLRLTLAGARYTVDAGGRLLSGSRGGDQWVEDWRLVRSSDPAVLAAAANPRCPACGAPLRVDAEGLCAYCRAVVPGAKSDWLVDGMAEAVDDPFSAGQQLAISQDAMRTAIAAAAAEAGPPDVGVPVQAGASAALAAIAAADPAFKVGDVVPIARQAFLDLDQSRVRLDPGLARPFVGDEQYAREVALAAAARQAGRHEVPAYLDIDSVEVAGAAADGEAHRLVFEVHARSALHVVDLATGGLVGGDDIIRPWVATLTFVRAAGVRTDPYRDPESGVCPACGAGLEVRDDGACAACGSHVTGGEYGWILSQVG
ncbi:MAG TPA: TIM44-like domain-containing protein [Candidatus Dormibacteraeota bacterium]|jgi:predicted lipid-binding transport protein (Tim44 family)|nr:TIM44-like domain-containing protein [Candidatus Dormibacteraeota bacterium]